MPLSKATALLRHATRRRPAAGFAGPDVLLARALRCPEGGSFRRLRALRWALLGGDGTSDVVLARQFRFASV